MASKHPLLRYSAILIIIVSLSCQSCMSTRIVANYDSDRPGTVKVTEWTFLWGLVQPKDVQTDELCESMCQVTLKNNIGYILISAVTLGIAVPMSAEYECCPFEPDDDEI